MGISIGISILSKTAVHDNEKILSTKQQQQQQQPFYDPLIQDNLGEPVLS